MFIQTEETPNPESIKFIPGRPVLDTEQDDFTGFYATRDDAPEIARSPLAKALFKIDAVKSVYFGSNFVTITKFAEYKWMLVQGLCFGAIMDFYATGKPAVTSTPEITDTTIMDDDDEVVAMIKELLETRIRPGTLRLEVLFVVPSLDSLSHPCSPMFSTALYSHCTTALHCTVAVQEDGGDIRYVGFAVETGIVTVKLAGSCVGCPSSSVTLKNGVENMLMHYIPEVTAVYAEEEAAEGSAEAPSVTEVVVEKTQKTYEERLKQAGIPFSD
jgi:NFU1 iron-sulfur cluster scaffold homolog, mitochondrial